MDPYTLPLTVHLGETPLMEAVLEVPLSSGPEGELYVDTERLNRAIAKALEAAFIAASGLVQDGHARHRATE